MGEDKKSENRADDSFLTVHTLHTDTQKVAVVDWTTKMMMMMMTMAKVFPEQRKDDSGVLVYSETRALFVDRGGLLSFRFLGYDKRGVLPDWV